MRLCWKHSAFCLFGFLTIIGCTSRNGAVIKKELSLKEMSAISQPTNEIVITTQAVISPVYMMSGHSIPVTGFVDYDKRIDKKVAARFGGRIEKLYVRYENQYVNKGDKIMEIYSPELTVARNEYLYLSRFRSDRDMLRRARQRLLLLGLTDEQINSFSMQSGNTIIVAIFSPNSGYVRFQDQAPEQLASSIQQQGGGMGSMPNSNPGSEEQVMATAKFREGSYIVKGQTLFTINDLSTVWGVFALEGGLAEKINPGSPLQVHSELLDSDLETSVGFVEPVYRQGQKFLLIRAYIANKDSNLKINSLLTANVFPGGKKHLMLAESAVYDLGNKKIVWLYTGRKVGRGSIFKAVPVFTGASSEGQVEIIGGISYDSRVARDAGFMVDRESFTKVK